MKEKEEKNIKYLCDIWLIQISQFCLFICAQESSGCEAAEELNLKREITGGAQWKRRKCWKTINFKISRFFVFFAYISIAKRS